MTLTKADMAEQLCEEIGLSKRETQDFIDLFFQTLVETLERGEAIKLSGFGNFTLHDKNGRPGLNPKTGEKVPIAARRVVTFRAGGKLRARIEGLRADPGEG